MSSKRKHDGEQSHATSAKKQKHGFRVGPQNLPDGTYRRKTQKIKSALIERAQIKKDYAKLKKRQVDAETSAGSSTVSGAAAADDEAAEHGASAAPHPDRQALMEGPEETTQTPGAEDSTGEGFKRRPRRPKSMPFQREFEAGQKRNAEIEERRRAREEAEKQRQRKAEERERFRRAMAKARAVGPNGQRKLGRESKVLLERVKRMVAEP